MAKHKGSKRKPPQKTPPLTHFLCIPLINPKSRPLLEASIAEFRKGVSIPVDEAQDGTRKASGNSQESNLATLHPKAVRPAGTLHLTIGVMSLDESKLSEATDYLNGDEVRTLLKNTLEGTSDTVDSGRGTHNVANPLEIQLKGLESMHPVKKTSVLYAAPEDKTARLYPLCLALEKLFKDRGFLIDQNRSLILHATVVNMVYAKGRKGPAKRGFNKSASDFNQKVSTDAEDADNSSLPLQSVDEPSIKSQELSPPPNVPLRIDAAAILEAYKDFLWVDNMVLDRVAICKMGAKKILDEKGNVIDEEYEEAASVLFPD